MAWKRRDRDCIICRLDGHEIRERATWTDCVGMCATSQKRGEYKGWGGGQAWGQILPTPQCLFGWLKSEFWGGHYILLFQKQRPDTWTLSFVLLTISSYIPSWCLISAWLNALVIRLSFHQEVKQGKKKKKKGTWACHSHRDLKYGWNRNYRPMAVDFMPPPTYTLNVFDMGGRTSPLPNTLLKFCHLPNWDFLWGKKRHFFH